MNFEIKEIENFNDLFERLKTDDYQHAQIIGEYNGSYAVMRDALERFNSRRSECDYEFDFIRGMLWGLYATRFITEAERETLTEILINN